MRAVTITIDNLESRNIRTLLHDAANVFADVINSDELIKHLEDGLMVTRVSPTADIHISTID